MAVGAAKLDRTFSDASAAWGPVGVGRVAGAEAGAGGGAIATAGWVGGTL